MKYALTAHAKTVIEAREIRPEWIERALGKPQRTELDEDDADLMHYLAAIPAREERVLRVVVNTKSRPVKIVTVFFDRKLRGKL